MDELRLEPRAKFGLLPDGLERSDRGLVRSCTNQPAEKSSEAGEPGTRRATRPDE
jgi:hypothetical protein